MAAQHHRRSSVRGGKYWRESAALVRENYLPRAQSWACWHDDEIVGFISVLDEQFIGALFVERAFHGRGVARR